MIILEEFLDSISTYISICVALVVFWIFVNIAPIDIDQPKKVIPPMQYTGKHTCSICCEENVDLMVLIPCGHTYCNVCCSKIKHCPLCSEQIICIIRPFYI